MLDRRDKIRAKIAARTFVCAEVLPGLKGPCHLWTGPDSGKIGRGAGYPRMCLDGQTVAVHLVAWTNEHGYIPGRKTLDHLCKNRMCINLDHLEMVTMKENAKRRDARNGVVTRRRRAAKKKREPVDNRKYEEYIPPTYHDEEGLGDIPF